MLNQHWILGAACLCLCGSSAVRSAASNTVVQASQRYTVQVWEADDGLPQNSVIAMTQTRDGYLWLGTLNGLVRFDGRGAAEAQAGGSENPMLIQHS